MSEDRPSPLIDRKRPPVSFRDGGRRASAAVLYPWICVCLLISPGCALYSPYQVFRFTADYNTERRLSLQGEVFEHLPPHPVRVRLNTWAYNVGPQQSSLNMSIPANSPISPTEPPPRPALPSEPPLPHPSEPFDSDLLDESLPPEFSPASPGPRTDLRSEERGGRMGPSARANGSIRGASYEVPSPQRTPPPRPTGTWLFTR